MPTTSFKRLCGCVVPAHHIEAHHRCTVSGEETRNDVVVWAFSRHHGVARSQRMLAAGAGRHAPVMITGAHPALVSDTSRINSGVS
jgi:hypothetical protein